MAMFKAKQRVIRVEERYIEVKSKEEVLEKVKKPKGLLEVIPSSFNNNPISKVLNK